MARDDVPLHQFASNFGDEMISDIIDDFGLPITGLRVRANDNFYNDI